MAEWTQQAISISWRHFDCARGELLVHTVGTPQYESTQCLLTHVKHIVGGSEGDLNDLFECFSTGFSEDSPSKLERSEIRR